VLRSRNGAGLRGPDGDVEGIGRVRRGQADVIRQGEDRALVIADATQRAFELIAIRERRRAVCLRRLGRQDRDLRAPPPPMAADVRGCPDDEAVQPGIEPLDARATSVDPARPAPAPPGSHPPRVRRRAGSGDDAVQPIDGTAGQHAEGLAVSASCPVDELRLHASLLRRRPIWSPIRTAECQARRFKFRAATVPVSAVSASSNAALMSGVRSRRGRPRGGACPRTRRASGARSA